VCVESGRGDEGQLEDGGKCYLKGADTEDAECPLGCRRQLPHLPHAGQSPENPSAGSFSLSRIGTEGSRLPTEPGAFEMMP
jgi:hypothetical protein